MSNKKKYICEYGIPGGLNGCNTTEDLARYLDSDPHPEYHLVSCNWMNGIWHMVWELKEA